MKETLAVSDEPSVVADVVLHAVSAARPKLRYTAGPSLGVSAFCAIDSSNGTQTSTTP
jgi:hypothetical protein